MSHTDHAHDEHAPTTGGHDGDHDEQDDVLAPDEHPTPFWLTALGGALFLAAGMWWLLSRPTAPTLDQLRGDAPAADTSAAPAAKPAPAPQGH